MSRFAHTCRDIVHQSADSSERRCSSQRAWVASTDESKPFSRVKSRNLPFSAYLQTATTLGQTTVVAGPELPSHDSKRREVVTSAGSRHGPQRPFAHKADQHRGSTITCVYALRFGTPVQRQSDSRGRSKSNETRSRNDNIRISTIPATAHQEGVSNEP